MKTNFVRKRTNMQGCYRYWISRRSVKVRWFLNNMNFSFLSASILEKIKNDFSRAYVMAFRQVWYKICCKSTLSKFHRILNCNKNEPNVSVWSCEDWRESHVLKASFMKIWGSQKLINVLLHKEICEIEKYYMKNVAFFSANIKLRRKQCATFNSSAFFDILIDPRVTDKFYSSQRLSF